MSAIALREVVKSFGSTPVLRGVSLEVEEGSIAAVLGASGSGKTTLLRLLAGFETVDAGVVSLADRVVDDGDRSVRAQHRGVGFVPQDGALFPHLTVAGNVGFGLPRGVRGDVGALLSLVGLADLGERYPHQLSGGQQQRVALARALAIKPRVVLLDEPFSSLDASLRLELRQDVARILREAATTTVLVTHDQDEALAIADTVAVLGEGRVVACADPRTLYRNPPDVAAALSIGAANVLPAVITGGVASCALGSVAVDGSNGASGAVELLLRPEQLVLAAAASERAVSAELLDLDYHGHDAVARIRVEGLEPLLARVPGEVAFTSGQRVWVSVVGAGRAWPA